MRELTESEKRTKAVKLWEEATALLHSAYYKADRTNRLMANRSEMAVEQTALALDKMEEAMALGFCSICDEDIEQRIIALEAKRKQREEQRLERIVANALL